MRARLVGEEPGGSGDVADQLSRGVREVEGPPPPWDGDGAGRWRRDDLAEDLLNPSGRRSVMLGRSREERRAWRGSAAAQAALRRSVRAVLEQVYVRHGEVRPGRRLDGGGGGGGGVGW